MLSPTYQQSRRHSTSSNPQVVTVERHPIVPRLNLIGLAPPILGYGVAAAGESPATTGTLSSYRFSSGNKNNARGRAALIRSCHGSLSTSTASTPHGLSNSTATTTVLIPSTTGSSTQQNGGNDDRRHHSHREEIRQCIVLCGVILGGLFVRHSDSRVPDVIQPLEPHWHSSIDRVVADPAALVLFLLVLIIKAKFLFGGRQFVDDLTETGEEWIDGVGVGSCSPSTNNNNALLFSQLMKLVNDDFDTLHRSADLTERLGTGTFSSIWRLASSPDLAVKAVSLPPVCEQSIWYQSNDNNGDEDGDDDYQFVRWLPQISFT